MNLKEIKYKLESEYKAYENIFKKGILSIEPCCDGLSRNIRYFSSDETPIHNFIQICDEIDIDKDLEYLDIETKISCLEQELKGIYNNYFFSSFFSICFIINEKYCGVLGDSHIIKVSSSHWDFMCGYNNWNEKKKILLDNSLQQSKANKEIIDSIVKKMDRFCAEYDNFKENYKWIK